MFHLPFPPSHPFKQPLLILLQTLSYRYKSFFVTPLTSCQLKGKGQIRMSPLSGGKLISFCAVWLNHKAVRNESPPSLFHYSVRPCYRALNIASLYIPFLPDWKKGGLFWTSGVYYMILYYTRSWCLSPFLFLSLSLHLLDLWATTDVFQLQMRKTFATWTGNR